MEEGVLLIGALGFCFAISYFLGRKRQIGAGWAFFFSLFLSPLIGFIIVMLSPKYYELDPEPSSSRKAAGWVLIVLFSLSLIGSFARLESNPDALQAIFFAIGFIGLGYYQIERSKGRSFHSRELTDIDDDGH